MTSLRCVQNFNQRRALVVSADLRAIERLDDSLIRLGVRVEYVAVESDEIELSALELNTDRDILFLDGDLSTKVCVPHYADSTVAAIPVIGMVGIEAPSRLGRLFACGATAFIKKPIHVGTVFSTLFMAVNEHNQRLTLCRQLREDKDRRRQRRYVIKAVLAVMTQRGLSDERAYEWLRKQSMCAQISIEELSRRIVEQDKEPSVAM